MTAATKARDLRASLRLSRWRRLPFLLLRIRLSRAQRSGSREAAWAEADVHVRMRPGAHRSAITSIARVRGRC